jgi:hypothetical protein
MEEDILRRDLEGDGIRFLGFSRYDRLDDSYYYDLQKIPQKSHKIRKCQKMNRKVGNRGK